MHQMRDKPILFFNLNQTNVEKTRAGSLRGYKIKAKQESKVYDLKTKRVDRINIWKLRYSDYDIETTELGPKTERYEKGRATYENFRQRSLSNRGSFERRTIMENKNNMMVTSHSAQIEHQDQNPPEPLYFKSPNLQAKMNDYLNLVIKKSNEDHQNKIQELENLVQQKERKSNVFLRKMKKSLKKKNQASLKEQHDIVIGARDTLRLLQNFDEKKKQRSRRNSITDRSMKASQDK